MHIKTILNRVQIFNCFVYGPGRWVEDASEPTIEAELRPRANSRDLCSNCGRRRPGYDTPPVRRFEFIPMWGIKVFSSVEMSVAWGHAHQDLSRIEAIGVDEIAWQRGHLYLTLVYQIDAECRRLLWIGQERKVKTLLRRRLKHRIVNALSALYRLRTLKGLQH